MPQFTSLNVHAFGAGPYRLNRFRRYFRIPDDSRYNVISGTLGNHLYHNFRRIFSSDDAVVDFNDDHRWGGRQTLKFTGTASFLGLDNFYADILVPDVHNDWVGIHRQNFPHGFTVQTLKRNFRTGSDLKVATLTAAGSVIGNLATKGIFPVVPTVAVAIDVNQHHFLAGRRSWIVAPASFFGRTGFSQSVEFTEDLYALETSAIERVSGVIVQSVDSARLMGNLTEVIRRIWIRFVNNYVSRMGFDPVDISLWTNTDDGASYVEQSFADREALEGSSHFAEVDSKFNGIYPRNAV